MRFTLRRQGERDPAVRPPTEVSSTAHSAPLFTPTAGDVRLPLVYVRGFAGGTNGIDKQVDDPFYGFNDGSTHIRVGGDGTPQYYQFESPLVRLFATDGYRPLVTGDPKAYLKSCKPDSVCPQTIWIHRFYDAAADTFGEQAADFDIERAARDLYELVELVLEKTGAQKVNLVAHSMGGLVCRSMLQKWSYDSFGDFRPTRPGHDMVDKLVTYGTPHGGITFEVGGGVLDEFMEDLGPIGSEIFSPELMYGYLVPHATYGTKAPADWHANEIPEDGFDVDRILCIVGSDAGDYGLAQKVVGPQSDGLVAIKNAYVVGAHRAYVHRSHSGRYGLVNSEEGYQNLRRFLFGSKRVKIELTGLQAARPDSDGRPSVWQAELQLSIRGLPVVVNEQLAAHYCPIPLGPAADGGPVPLTTVFLLDPLSLADTGPESSSPSPRSRYALRLRVSRLTEQHGLLFWRDHLAQIADWEDTLIVDVGHQDDDPGSQLRLWAVWNSELPAVIAARDPVWPEPLDQDQDAVSLPLPAAARQFLGPHAALTLTPRFWN